MYQNTAEIIEANKREGGHFFDADAMRSFRSKVCTAHGVIGGRYFVTSEQFEGASGHREKRLYSVREAMPNGAIRDLGQFQQFQTGEQAAKFAQFIADNLKDGKMGQYDRVIFSENGKLYEGQITNLAIIGQGEYKRIGARISVYGPDKPSDYVLLDPIYHEFKVSEYYIDKEGS